MRKTIFGLLFGMTAAVGVMFFTSATQNDNVITKENGMTVINTTELTKSIRGFKGTTPVKIYISKNKVVRVEALPNKETPKFFERAKALLTFWDGKSVSKASKSEPDAVSGATLSSNALKKNVQMGLEYYKEHKK